MNYQDQDIYRYMYLIFFMKVVKYLGAKYLDARYLGGKFFVLLKISSLHFLQFRKFKVQIT